ncbi:hypothetical protein [Undibacterium terreum]|uniref:DUF3298 domain-containing protein n=1 Tax=Undibacterium terreum TaxID=1224302 RepID=A0A916UA60_9BURK|nr:hypothetical protein [Undibacterium terreum]GGC66234.1 hypothetical protein GCM10011396_11590 [Undibacterium terreum]
MIKIDHIRYKYGVSIFLVFASHLLLATFAFASAESDSRAPIVFKYARAEVQEWKGDSEAAPENGSSQIVWEYPVFLQPQTPYLQKLNAWTRTLSLNSLFYDEELLPTALKMRDSAVVKALEGDKAVREAAITNSLLSLDRAFGQYLFFTLFEPHTSKSVVFDTVTSEAVPIESFFKDDAEAELHQLLANAIAKEFEQDNQTYKRCLKKSANDHGKCERQLDINHLDACTAWRSFNWNFLAVESKRKLTISFPYHPGQRKTCGDEFYVLENKRIESLFISPTIFRHAREIQNIKQ